MNVTRILAEKGSSIVTIGPNETLADAAASLSSRRIGAVPVVEGDAVLGILSERDVVRAVGQGGAAVLSELVSDHMTQRVVTCRGETTVDDLMALMTSGKFRHVPVVEDGKLVGIVSIGDVVKLRIAEVEAEHQAMRDYIAAA
jgi:CBS domain-containing protein